MLDIKVLREQPDHLRQNLLDRNATVFDDLPADGDDWAQRTVERLVHLDRHYLDLLHEQEVLRQRQNENAQAIKNLGKLPEDEQPRARAALIEDGRSLREREKHLATATEKALTERDEGWSRVPNVTHPDAPRGIDAASHRVVRERGVRRDFAREGFLPRDHLAIAEDLRLVDFAAGAKIAGQKFYYLRNDAVLLDLALQHYALAAAQRHGFVLHVTPDMARADIVHGLGFNPRGESTQIYGVAGTDLCLVGTAEITLGGMLADTIVDQEALPLLLAGVSHCFRTEAGSAGQESRGLYRVHQFTKVELFAFTEGDIAVSDPMHRRFLAIEEEIFDGLGIPYRVLDMATGDLAAPAHRKYDLEAWLPGRNDWGEITSTSNCTDYQARRLKIRYRESASAGKKKGQNRFVHMLNGTAVATSRAIVAILENNQQADGSVVVPEVLRPIVGKDIIRKA